MKLLPIRFGLLAGDLRVVEVTLFDREPDEQPKVVRTPRPFGFYVAADEVCDELELHLETEDR